MKFWTRLKQPKPQSPGSPPSHCCICKEVLDGAIFIDEWNNGAHRSHDLYFCSSCHRILSPYGSAGAFRYSDGRRICGYCKKIAVTDGVQANRGRRKVLARLEAVGFQGIPKNIEIVLSHPSTLAAHSRKANTSGLTLSHFHFTDHKRVGITHQVGILFGLPQVEFEAVMAHEFLHVWQQQNDVKFSPLYSEGLCELGGLLIYSQEDSDLARHLLQKMQQNPDPVYGNGFRLMAKKLECLGWDGLIREILVHKRGFEAGLLKKIFGGL